MGMGMGMGKITYSRYRSNARNYGGPEPAKLLDTYVDSPLKAS